jgi:hypothetical protein
MRVGELLTPIVAAMGRELLQGDYIQAAWFLTKQFCHRNPRQRTLRRLTNGFRSEISAYRRMPSIWQRFSSRSIVR